MVLLYSPLPMDPTSDLADSYPFVWAVISIIKKKKKNNNNDNDKDKQSLEDHCQVFMDRFYNINVKFIG